ncbi:hypothetical protein QR680_012106 [Steinernema hermaphroditum]|uniref:Peptidase S1 domain-containing protein n=1 Tax=Steinernema hermaphroditum TaxID=289476 RepID=A0AA39I2V5_9BILA|nr:hypothetical protein QR680_012106 [Steinernema hermaphroditum]
MNRLLFIAALLCMLNLDLDAYFDANYEWDIKNRPLDRLVGRGTNAQDGEVPWAVAIEYKKKYRCTGTLISKKHVLTAAHCFVENGHKSVAWNCQRNKFLTEEDAVQHMTVQYGAACLLPDQPACENYTATMTKVNIKKALFRDFYELNGCKGGRDFALLQLESEVEGVNHICLPHLYDTTKVHSAKNFHSYGWENDLERENLTSTILQNVILGVLLRAELCKTLWGDMSDDTICAIKWNTYQVGMDSLKLKYQTISRMKYQTPSLA